MSEEVVKPPFKRSAESERAFLILEGGKVGQLITYEQMEQIIGEDPRRGAGYSIMRGVRLRLIRETGAVWFVVTSVGYQRATFEETLELMDAGVDGVRRKTRRTGELIKTVEYEELDAENKREYNFLSSVIGALGLFFGRPGQRRLREQVKRESAMIDNAKVLAIFQEG